MSATQWLERIAWSDSPDAKHARGIMVMLIDTSPAPPLPIPEWRLAQDVTETQALAWLDYWADSGIVGNERQARTIKAMLAAPRLPDVSSHEAIDNAAHMLWMGSFGKTLSRNQIATFLREGLQFMSGPPKPAKPSW